MSETLVRELSDGEELVLEGRPATGLVEDPRERTIEVRRLAVQRDKERPPEGKSPANPPRTEGLTPLDRDRASSIADEGGTSAATVESQRHPSPPSGPNAEGEDEADPG